jgi:hypothetical protein
MIKAGFILLTILMATLLYIGIAAVANRAITDASKQKQFKTRSLLILGGWLTYVSLLSLTGIFTTAELPPRVPLLLILPCLLFIFWFFKSNRFSNLISATPAGWLVYMQGFRIVVELLLLGMYTEGMIPRASTFEGYNYEILIGVSAFGIGYFGYTKKVLPPNLIIFWNFAGNLTLAIIGFIMISHAYFPHIYTNPGYLSIKEFGSFPYTLFAGFIAPVAIFMHIFSIIKTKREVYADRDTA